MTGSRENKGLGGWLILVGIGVLLGPFRMVFVLYQVYKPIFDDGTLTAMLNEGASTYNPEFAALLIGEVCFNLIVLCASLYLIYLFFSKHYRFPVVYIAIISASLIFIPFDAWIVSFFFPEDPIFDAETTKEFAKMVISALIWIPYMLVSNRVRLTFVRNAPEVIEQVENVESTSVALDNK